MPKPVCVACGRFFRPTYNGICITEGMPIVQDALPGKEHAAEWGPYKLWRGDKWTCEGCGVKIIVGFAYMPFAEHYEPDFKEKQIATNADKTWVYDC